MSQQPMEQMNMDGQPQGSPQVETASMPGQDGDGRGSREEEFSLGLDAALNENESGGAVPQENEQEEESRAAPEETPATAAPVAPQAGPDTAYAPEQPLHEPAAPQEAKPVPESPQVPGKTEMPEHLQNEFERLQAIDSELAQLALEDSADGQAIRARLEEYGAAIAHDHARLVVLTRQQRHDMEQMRQEQAMRDEQARQAHFMGVMQQEHPDFYSLITGKDQAAQVRFRNEMLSWIQGKPYAEAAPLMQIFQSSRDPRQVAGLLTQFKSERAAAKRPDPTGALAVPGRGGTVAPAGIGDKDDFDAGLDAGLSSD